MGRPRKRLRCGLKRIRERRPSGHQRPETAGRQIGRSADRQVGRSAGRQVGRSESLGPCKVQRDNWAEVTQAAMPDLGHVERPTHTTGCLPKLRRRFHGWGSFLIGVYSHLGASDYFSQINFLFAHFFYFYSIRLTIFLYAFTGFIPHLPPVD